MHFRSYVLLFRQLYQLSFKLVTVQRINNELSKSYVSVISLIMFYESRNKLRYKVVGSVVYTIIDEYIYLDYLASIQDKLSKHDNNFKKTKFKSFSGLGIPEILMNIMSYHIFVKSPISTIILKCSNSLVLYYIS